MLVLNGTEVANKDFICEAETVIIKLFVAFQAVIDKVQGINILLLKCIISH